MTLSQGGLEEGDVRLAVGDLRADTYREKCQGTRAGTRAQEAGWYLGAAEAL